MWKMAEQTPTHEDMAKVALGNDDPQTAQVHALLAIVAALDKIYGELMKL
jgi:hypothetical protein